MPAVRSELQTKSAVDSTTDQDTATKPDVNMRHWGTAAGLLVEKVVGKSDEGLDTEESNNNSTEYGVCSANSHIEL